MCRFSNSRIPILSSHLIARSLRSALSTPRILRPNSTFSRAVRNGKSASDCHTSGVSRSCGATSFITRSFRRISPMLGASRPASMRSVVVLPHPDGPIMARNSPSRISKSSSFTATKSPKCFCTLSKTTSGLVMIACPSFGGWRRTTAPTQPVSLMSGRRRCQWR